MAELQVFRRRNVVVCVKIGYIAVDIPYEWKVRKAELRGISNPSESRSSFFDIALNGDCILHIVNICRQEVFRPFFWERYPF